MNSVQKTQYNQQILSPKKADQTNKIKESIFQQINDKRGRDAVMSI